MSKMKKAALAALAMLSMVFGGMVMAAPAQAVAGSTVYYIGRDSSVPSSWRLVTTSTTGVVKRLAVSTTVGAGNVFRACPSDLGGRIRYRHPNGTLVTLAYGACFNPGSTGVYTVRAIG